MYCTNSIQTKLAVYKLLLKYSKTEFNMALLKINSCRNRALLQLNSLSTSCRVFNGQGIYPDMYRLIYVEYVKDIYILPKHLRFIGRFNLIYTIRYKQLQSKKQL
jgi:hypothetical protein